MLAIEIIRIIHARKTRVTLLCVSYMDLYLFSWNPRVSDFLSYKERSVCLTESSVRLFSVPYSRRAAAGDETMG